jgi:hypothetical protein
VRPAQRRLVRLCAAAAFALTVGAAASSASEEEVLCMIDASMPLSGIVPDSGQVQALIILARFKDDQRRSWNDGWPVNPNATRKDALPVWADSLIENVPPGNPPQVAGSLTHYFDLMSRGKLRFNGAVYESVVVLNETCAEYVAAYGGYVGRSVALKDVLDSLDSFGHDFAENDYDGDFLLDYVSIVFRGMATFDSCSGASNQLNYEGGYLANGSGMVDHFIGGGPYRTAYYRGCWVGPQGSRVPAAQYPASQQGTIDCMGCVDCPVATQSLRWYQAVIAHEAGHSLCINSSFLRNAFHIHGMATWGQTSGVGGGVSPAVVRHYLGWLDPIVVPPGTNALGVKIYDTVGHDAPGFLDNDSLCVKITTSDPKQFFILENRRASPPYTKSHNVSYQWDVGGQAGSGLLITHVNENGEDWWPTATENLNKRFNIEVATGHWDTAFEPDAARGRTAISAPYGKDQRSPSGAHPQDTFGPGTNTLFAPYTCPNTNLYGPAFGDTAQTIATGLTVRNVQVWSDSSITLDIIWNESADSTTSNTQWTDLVILSDDFEIAAGDTVEVTEDAVVLFRGGGSIAHEGVDTSRVELPVKGFLDLEPEFDGVGPTFGSSRDTALRKGPYANADSLPAGVTVGTSDWYGIRLPSLAKLDVDAATIKHARAAIAMETNDFVNPSRFEGGSHELTLLDNYNKLSFDRDVLVPLDSVFVLPSGFTLGFAADRDEGHLAGLARQATRAELVVQGTVDFRGNSYYDRVIIRSDDPDATDAQKLGDWGGMVLLPFPPDSNCADTRDLDFTLFRDAVHGIVPVDTCLMKMNWPLFENNDSSDIYLDRDVVIREGIQVDLRAPTRFLVKAGSSAVDLTGGDPGKVDFIVRGKLVGRRPGVVPASEWIRFESTAKDSLNGDDWGGLVFDWTSGGSVLEDADIGWAVNPIFLYYPDSLTTIQGCRIHHFNDKGVWVYGTMGVGAVIDSCTIERGVGLSTAGPSPAGATLVRLDYTDDLRLERTRLDLTGLLSPLGSAAVDSYFGKIHCLTSSGQTDSLIIRKNWVIGPGAGALGGRRGIRAFWLCGSTSRKILLDENYVEGFRSAALEFNQSSDAQVNCNTAVGNRRAVDFYRDASATGPGVRFKSNWLEVKEQTSTEVVRTDDNVKTKLGPHQSTMGDNGLMAERTLVNFIRENDPSAGDKLDARDSYWYLFTAPSGPEELISDPLDSFEITNRIAPSAIDVLYGPFYTDDTNPTYCRATSPPTSGAAAIPIREPAIGQAEDRDVGRVEGGEATELRVPRETFLADRRGGASGSGVTLEIGVALSDEGMFVLDVFDVRGRRVARLVDGPLEAGTHVVSWRDGTASGVYFARLQSASIVKIRKLVVLR